MVEFFFSTSAVTFAETDFMTIIKFTKIKRTVLFSGIFRRKNKTSLFHRYLEIRSRILP